MNRVKTGRVKVSTKYVEKVRALKMSPGDVIRTNDGRLILWVGADGCWDTEFGVVDDTVDDDLAWGAFTELGDIASSYEYASILDNDPVIVLHKGHPVTDDKVLNQQQKRIEDLEDALFRMFIAVREIRNSV